MTRLIAVLILALSAAPGEAETVNGRISDPPESAYGGFPFQAFQFSLAAEEAATITLRSDAFDPIVVTISPEGVIRMNDDYGDLDPEDPGAVRPAGGARTLSEYDSAIRVASPATGEWIVVVGTYGKQDRGAYSLSVEGVGASLAALPDSRADEAARQAFAARGVVPPKETASAQLDRGEQFQHLLKPGRPQQALLAALEGNLHVTPAAEAQMDQVEALRRREAELAAQLARLPEYDSDRPLIGGRLQITREQIAAVSQDAGAKLLNANALEAAIEDIRELQSLDRAIADYPVPEIEGGAPVTDEFAELVARRESLSARVAADLRDSAAFGLDGIAARDGYIELDPRRSADKGVTLEGGPPGASSPTCQSPGEIPFPGMYTDPEIEAWQRVLMPWPPPCASAVALVDRAFLDAVNQGRRPRQLEEVHAILNETLHRHGFGQARTFGAPNGFALVTSIEQIHEDGTPLEGRARHSALIAVIKSYSLTSFVNALLRAPVGYFRVVALVVTDRAFTNYGDRATLEEIREWADRGHLTLPKETARRELTPDHRIYALIYEFEKRNNSDRPTVTPPIRLTTREHLEHTALGDYVEGAR